MTAERGVSRSMLTEQLRVAVDRVAREDQRYALGESGQDRVLAEAFDKGGRHHRPLWSARAECRLGGCAGVYWSGTPR